MLKYQTWYALIWAVVVLLYCLGWSSLNSPLNAGLLAFFVVTIAASIFMARVSPRIPVKRLRWSTRRRPTITLLLCAGFAADWAYRGSLPVLAPYQGYDPNLTIGTTVGIPVFHVFLTAFGIYYAMYLGYLFVSDTSDKRALVDYALLLVLFLINNSRGYIVFILFTTLILYAAMNNKGIRGTKISTVLLIIFGMLFVIFFISAMGNVRSGLNWNDCSFIETIGVYTHYPSWLTKHFMWFYSYATSPLANLNLNCQLFTGGFDFKALLFSFLPEQLSNSVLVSATTPYITSYFTAETGFATFARAAGVFGVCCSFLGMLAYYTAIKAVLKRLKVLETFGNAVLCFLVVVAIFYSAFTTSSVCYTPLFLVVHSIWLARKAKEGLVETEEAFAADPPIRLYAGRAGTSLPGRRAARAR
jgi:hypothetical protein